MNWLSGLSDTEKREMLDDSRQAYRRRDINEVEFRMHLAKLGMNATDIEDEVKAFKPR